MAGVTFDGITKTYPDGTTAVERSRPRDRATASSWCSSARRAAARRRRCAWSRGSRRSRGGVLKIGDRVVNHVPSRDRDIAMVFQSYALYPHLIGLRQHRLRPEDQEGAEGGDRAARQRRRADPRPRAVPQAQAARALRRTAAARRDGPRDRARARGVPDGRAALEPRREAARADARRDRRPAARRSASRRSTSRTTRSRR